MLVVPAGTKAKSISVAFVFAGFELLLRSHHLRLPIALSCTVGLVVGGTGRSACALRTLASSVLRDPLVSIRGGDPRDGSTLLPRLFPKNVSALHVLYVPLVCLHQQQQQPSVLQI